VGRERASRRSSAIDCESKSPRVSPSGVAGPIKQLQAATCFRFNCRPKCPSLLHIWTHLSLVVGAAGGRLCPSKQRTGNQGSEAGRSPSRRVKGRLWAQRALGPVAWTGSPFSSLQRLLSHPAPLA
jgi:hypothetical protein